MPNMIWDIMTYYIINDRDMTIGIQLKDLVWNHLTALLKVTMIADKHKEKTLPWSYNAIASELQCDSFKLPKYILLTFSGEINSNLNRL